MAYFAKLGFSNSRIKNIREANFKMGVSLSGRCEQWKNWCAYNNKTVQHLAFSRRNKMTEVWKCRLITLKSIFSEWLKIWFYPYQKMHVHTELKRTVGGKGGGGC